MKLAAAALSIALLVVAVYAQTLGHDFLRYDDPIYVTENPMLRDPLGVDSLRRAFSEPYEANWIPLTWVSLQLDAALHGMGPSGYHATNALLHALAALLLLLALRRASGDLAPSAFVAAVFALHPLHVESVAWIAERKDTLSAVFFALVLWLHAGYARRPGGLRYLGVVAATALGLLAKPMLVTLPFVLLLLDFWPLQRLRNRQEALRAGLEKLPLLALAVLASALALYAQRRYGSMDHGELLAFPLRAGNALLSVALYLRDSFWPTNLSVFYPHPQDALAGWQVAVSALIVVCVSALSFALRRSAPWLLVGWLWFLGMLVPVIGLVQVGMQGRADRYTYLPQIGLAIALAWSVQRGLQGRAARRAAPFVALATVAALALAAHLQVRHWRNTETLFRHATRVDPGNWFAHQWVGNELLLRGDVDAAEQAFRRSAELRPEWAAAHLGLADVHAARQDWSAAIRAYERALRLRPRDATAHMRLARALGASGQLAEALGRARYAVSLARGREKAEAQLILAFVHLERGEAKLALAQCDRAGRLEPELVEVWSMRGLALLRLGRDAEASQSLEKAAALAEQQDDPELARSIRELR